MAVIEQNHREEILMIPAYLVYEEMDGEAIPYKGYREVLAGDKIPEEIMGSSSLQAVVVYVIGLLIGNSIDRKKYYIGSNESGLHLSTGNNLANDLAIFDRENVKLDNKYFNVAPKVVIEVDSKADLRDTSYETEKEYFIRRSQKMLDFGVEKVVWVLIHSRKVIVSTADQDWIITDFDRDIPLLDDCVLNLAQLLADEGIEY